MLETVIGILLIVMGIFLVISVLMQSSKNHRMSGSVAGGAETFFGKQKGKQLDAMFNTATTVVTIIFVILVIVLYMMQPAPKTEEEIFNQYLAENNLTVEDLINTENGTDAEATDESEVADGAETTDVVEEATDAAETPVEEAETADTAETPAE